MTKIVACVLTWYMAQTFCMAVGDPVSESRTDDRADSIATRVTGIIHKHRQAAQHADTAVPSEAAPSASPDVR